MAGHASLKSLLRSEAFANYGLRAAFFSRKLRELRFLGAWQEVRKLQSLKESFDWSGRSKWGISEQAWNKAAELKLDPVLCFLHPRVLAEQPSLLLYYRCVALLSQKGLQALAGVSAAGIEVGKRTTLPSEARQRLVTAVNSVASVVVCSLDQAGVDYLRAFLYASAGAQIQGSWNNAIGVQGEVVVKQLVIENLKGELRQIVWKDDSTTDAADLEHTAIRDRLLEVKVLRLTEGFHCLFGSEPDLSFRGPDDAPLVAVEIKAGTDPAGALERLGAAMKSFDNDRSINPRVTTVYVVSCLTPEVRHRIDQLNPFDYTFLLGDLLTNRSVQKRFVSLFVREIVSRQKSRATP